MARLIESCAAAAVLGAAACSFIGPARAQVAPPTTIAGIICDTEDEVRAIVTANQQGGDAMRTAYQQLNTQLDAQGMPMCITQEVPHLMVSIPQSIDVGPWPEQGQVLEAFTLHLQSTGVDVWFLYLGPRTVSNGPI